MYIPLQAIERERERERMRASENESERERERDIYIYIYQQINRKHVHTYTRTFIHALVPTKAEDQLLRYEKQVQWFATFKTPNPA